MKWFEKNLNPLAEPATSGEAALGFENNKSHSQNSNVQIDNYIFSICGTPWIGLACGGSLAIRNNSSRSFWPQLSKTEITQVINILPSLRGTGKRGNAAVTVAGCSKPFAVVTLM